MDCIWFEGVNRMLATSRTEATWDLKEMATSYWTWRCWCYDCFLRFLAMAKICLKRKEKEKKVLMCQGLKQFICLILPISVGVYFLGFLRAGTKCLHSFRQSRVTTKSNSYNLLSTYPIPGAMLRASLVLPQSYMVRSGMCPFYKRKIWGLKRSNNLPLEKKLESEKLESKSKQSNPSSVLKITTLFSFRKSSSSNEWARWRVPAEWPGTAGIRGGPFWIRV